MSARRQPLRQLLHKEKTKSPDKQELEKLMLSKWKSSDIRGHVNACNKNEVHIKEMMHIAPKTYKGTGHGGSHL